MQHSIEVRVQSPRDPERSVAYVTDGRLRLTDLQRWGWASGDSNGKIEVPGLTREEFADFVTQVSRAFVIYEAAAQAQAHLG